MESGLNSDTEQVEVLPEEIVAAPVFVDSTGKRRRRFRTVGFIAGGIGVAYAAMLGLSFAGGPVAPNALLPIPGVPTSAPLAKADQPESELSAVSSDEKISRGDDGNRGDRIDSTSTPRPTTTMISGKPVIVTPTPSGSLKPTTPTKSPSVSPTPSKSPSVSPTPSKSPSVSPPASSKPADPPASSKPADPPASSKPADPPASSKPADPPASTPVTGGGTGAGGGGSDPTKPPANDPPATSNPPATNPAPSTPESTTES